MNVRLLVATIALLLVAAPAIFFWHKYQLGRTAGGFIARAEALAKNEDWAGAATNYQRYLTLRPDDTVVQLQLVEAFGKQAQTDAQLYRLNSMIYVALGTVPDRDDLRLKLAENLLQLRNFSAAEIEALKLKEAAPEISKPAQKVIALSQVGLAREKQGGKYNFETALGSLLAAVEVMPEDVQLVPVTAALLRRYPSAVDLKGKSSSSLADEIMDVMVASNPQSPEALLARYRYRMQYKLPDAEGDLETALEVAPNHVETLLMTAAQRTNQPERAETALRKAIEVAPQDPRAYIFLARVLRSQNKLQDSIELLQASQKVASPDDVSVEPELIDLFLATNQLDKAKERFTAFEQKAQRLRTLLDTSAKTRLENLLRLVRAQIDLTEGNDEAAIAGLKAIHATRGSQQSAASSPQSLRAAELLAKSFERLNRWDLAAAYWDEVAQSIPVGLDPGNQSQEMLIGLARVYQFAGNAYLRAGQPELAIERFEQSKHFGATPDVLLSLATAHRASQMRRPKSDRNWSEMEAALDEARTVANDDWRLVLLEADYLLSDDSPESVSKATELFRESEARFSTVAELFRTLAVAYTRLQLPDDAQRALATYESLEDSTMRRVVLLALVDATAGKLDAANQRLSDALPSLSKEEQREVQLSRLQLLTKGGQHPAARKLVAQLLEQSKQDETLLRIGIGMALTAKDWKSAERWETDLARVSGRDDFEWRHLRARRLLATFAALKPEERFELSRLIDSIRSERPRWYPAAALDAQLARLTNDPKRALREFQVAVELGDNRPETIQQIVTLLFEESRFEEAEQYLARLKSGESNSSQFDSLTISLALSQDRKDEALQLAKESAARHPEDGIWRLWYANVLLLKGMEAEAEKEFQDAVAQFPDDIRIWNGLLRFYVQQGDKEQARQILSTLGEKESIDATTRYLVLAEGYNILGDAGEAIRCYEEALQSNPNHVEARLRLARLLMPTDVTRARKELQEVLRLQPQNVEARRQLATLLAASGDEQDWNQALELLQARDEASAESNGTASRMRALLLTRRGRNREERLKNHEVARSILQEQLKSPSANEIDRLLLAGVFEQESRLRNDRAQLLAAREQLRSLVDRVDPQVSHLRVYVDFLLRSAEACKESSSEDDVRFVDLFLDDAESRIKQLEQLGPQDDAQLATLDHVGLEARLLQAKGQAEEARELVENSAEEQLTADLDLAEKARILLRTGRMLSSLQQHAAAEKWYRKLLEIVPTSYELLVRSLATQGRTQDAIEVCLKVAGDKPSAEVAATLAQLATSSESSQNLAEIEPLVATAMMSHGDNINLLMAVAVMKVSQEKPEEAIRIFQDVVATEPKNIMALNNLATLLAEHSNQHAEALGHIQRAIAVAGRQPPLLDTLGTILFRKGDYQEAVLNLEEAVAGEANDPRYYLHLAAALERSQQDEKAQEAFDVALQNGLQKTILTAGDRELLEALQENFPAAATAL